MQKYRIKRTIGDGSFGTVFEAITPNNEVVAIKKMKQKYKDWQQCNCLRQIKSLKKFNHPNIIKLKQVILANGQLYLVFDSLQSNLLQVYTRASEAGRTLTETQIKGLFYKILQGLAYLHKNGYFHRDLKPQNILCHNLQVKICDFGIARQIRSMPPFTQYVSTRWYRAPQLLLHSSSYNSPVDIFALACIVVELFTFQPLFPGVNQIDTLNKIVEVLGTPKKSDWPEGYKLADSMRYHFPESKAKGLVELIPKASIQLVELLQSMLCYSSRKRPSANDILKNPYFDHFTPTVEKQQTENQELRYSFYEKNIVEIPKNMKIQNPKEIEMRKSLYKMGDSFTSNFQNTKSTSEQKQLAFGAKNPILVNHLKQQQQQQQPKHLKLSQKKFLPPKSNSPILDHPSSQKKNSYLQKQDDDINKKFDEMQKIVLELKQKQQMKNNNQYYPYTISEIERTERIQRYKIKKRFNQREPELKTSSQNHNNLKNCQGGEELRLRMFSLQGGIGSITAHKSIPNMKAQAMKGSLLNMYNNNLFHM